MRTLRPLEVFCYGIGHFLNDMTAGLWFSFLLIFLTEVAHLDAAHAGTVMLSGQLWVFMGAVLVNLSFFFVFNECWVCESTGLDPVIWFSILASVFNVGWAALQVAHMALVPDLATDEHERTRLNSARYAGNIGATLAVLAITTVCFRQLGLSYGAFRITSLSAMAVGDVMTVIFLIGVREPQPKRTIQRKANTSPSTNSDEPSQDVHESLHGSMRRSLGVTQIPWYAWFRRLPFYQVMWIYMVSRIAVNLSQVYMPFYLRSCLHLVVNADVLAEVPAVIMCTSFVTTLAMREFNAGIGRLACYAFGTVLVAFASMTLFVVQADWWWSVFVFGVIIGIGQTALLVTAVSMEADLVDRQVQTGAFVYGFMSFADKIGNGILIKFMAPFTQDDLDLRFLNSLLPAGAAVVGLLCVLTMPLYWSQLRSKLTCCRKSSKETKLSLTGAAAHSDEPDLPAVPPPALIGNIQGSMSGKQFMQVMEEAERAYGLHTDDEEKGLLDPSSPSRQQHHEYVPPVILGPDSPAGESPP